VLEGVSQPALGVGLVEIARLYIGDDGDDWRRVVFLYNDGQAVRQSAAVD
jgi:hypothetical protein